MCIRDRILYLAGLLIFTLLPLPSDPVAACAAIIHWDNYVPFGSFVACLLYTSNENRAEKVREEGRGARTQRRLRSGQSVVA